MTERDKKAMLALIWCHEHRDYKGKIDGVKSILVLRDGATCLVPLDDLTEGEIANKYGYALRAEERRKAKAK